MRHLTPAERPHALTPPVVVLTAAVGLGLVAALLNPRAEAGGGVAPTTLVGTVVHVMPDRFGADPVVDPDDVLTFVTTETSAVPVSSDALAVLPTGTAVEVTVDPADAVPGDTVRSTAAGDAGGPIPVPPGSVRVLGSDGSSGAPAGAATTSAAQLPAPTTHQVTVVVADLPGRPAATVTAAQVAATVNGGIDDYWSDVTGGLVSFRATAYAGSADGHIDTRTSPCSNGSAGTTFDFWDEVADEVGFRDGPGQHLLVYFRNTSACGGIAGLATLSGSDAGGDLDGGGLVWTNGFNTVGVMGHELGHNLGLGHSQELRCGDQVDAGLTRCSKLSYNDLADIMGVSWGNTGFLNAVHLSRLGLLPAADVVDVGSSRSVTLRPMSLGSGVRVARLRAGGATYLIEARARVGADDWLGDSYGRPGVTVRKVLGRGGLNASESAAYPARESLLLDGDPGTADSLGAPADYRTVLPLDRWVPLSGGDLGVRVRSVGKSGSTIDVRVGAASAQAKKKRKARASKAEARIRTGALERTGSVVTVPSRWRWTVDPAGTARVRDASARGSVRAATSWRRTSYAHRVKVGGQTLIVRGKARARYLPESRGHYSGGWRKARSQKAFGHSVKAARQVGARASFAVSGRSFGIVARRAPHRGSFAVYVDGRRVGTAHLAGHRSGSPRVVWRTTLSRGGSHTVTLVRVRHRAALDGLVVLR